ncbi:MAG: hypothetical protein JWM52_518 [Candidatus Saccharibacteria bacterium]|nr:hypothetical protein [Candidatus Saccharibacteria bacterium]
MPNSLSTTWVKNVYSLGIVRGTKSVLLSPTYGLVNDSGMRGVHNSHYYPLLFPVLTSRLSTLKNIILYPLISHLYPLSTAPIIKKKKKS